MKIKKPRRDYLVPLRKKRRRRTVDRMADAAITAIKRNRARKINLVLERILDVFDNGLHGVCYHDQIKAILEDVL